MYNSIGTGLLAGLILFNNNVTAQSYKIKTFEGENATVKLQYKLMSSRTLAVSVGKDTVYLEELFGEWKVHIWDDKFLQITYDTRGGSGLGLQSTAFLSVIGGRINLDLLVISSATSQGPFRKGLLRMTFTLVGKNDSSRLLVYIHDKQQFLDHRSPSYEKFIHDTLAFDPQKHIFFNVTKKFSGSYTLNDTNTIKDKQHLDGAFPGVVLSTYSYFFINGSWFSRSDSVTLYKNYY